jgi:uncharacterized NAD(P)/FAD-binding protein YdhS
MEKIKICIIGCGASGTSVFIQLVKAICSGAYGTKYTPDRFVIYVFDSSGTFGPGIPYACPPNLIMNNPASMVNIFPNEDLDNPPFVQWIKESEHIWKDYFPNREEILAINKMTICPRKLVGLYLKDMVDQHYQTGIQHGIEIHLLSEAVTRVVNEDSSTTVYAGAQRYTDIKFIAFCVGNLGPETYERLIGHSPNFLPFTYMKDFEKKIPRGVKASILFIGSSLSAVDGCIMLNRPELDVAICSRKGFLPCVKKNIPWWIENKALTKEEIEKLITPNVKFDDLKETMDKELKYLYGSDSHGIEAVFEEPIRQQMTGYSMLDFDLARSGQPWEEIQWNFIRYVDMFWAVWDAEQRKRFLDYYRKNIHRYTSSFPYAAALEIKQLFDSGKVHIYQIAGDPSWNPETKKFAIMLKESFDKPAALLQFDYVVDATGYSRNFRHRHPVFRQLDTDGLMRFREDNSIPVQPNTMEFPTQLHAKCFIAGPACHPTFFYTNFLPFGSIHGQKVVRTIFSYLNDSL